MSPPVRPVVSDEMLPAQADVVVIGGGINGICAAWALARAGVSVAVVEKGVIGGEQSSRNWGWCRKQNRDIREIPLSIIALQMWETMAEDVGADVGFRRTGLVYASNNPKDIANWEAWGTKARGFGIDTRMLNAQQTAEHLPGNSRDWLGGVYSPTDGRAEPELAAPAIAEAARRAGATIHQNCAARELETSAGRVSGVVTEKGSIRCSSVLVAGGAWAGMFLRHHQMKFLQASVQSTSFYTAPAPEVTTGGVSMQDVTLRRRLDGGYTVGLSGLGNLHLTPWGALQAGPFWQTFLDRRAGLSFKFGRSFFNGPESLQRWRADSVSPFKRVRVLDPTPDMRLVARGVKGLETSYPTLKGIRVAQAWGGMVDCTPDALPVIAPVLARPGVFISAGFTGHGFGTGPAAGRLASELILGRTPCVDPAPFRYERMIDGSHLGKIGMM